MQRLASVERNRSPERKRRAGWVCTGIKPLLTAISARSPDLIRSALELGEDPNWRDESGRVPLHYCGIHKCASCAELLIQSGADINAEDQHGNQPLWTAVFEARGDYSVVSILMKAKADPNHRKRYGRSPQMFAEQIMDAVLVKLLALA